MPGYLAQRFTYLAQFGKASNGFIGCAFVAEDDSHIVIAYSGTNLKNFGDLTADLKIGLNQIPNQINNAKTIYHQVKDMSNGRPIFIVGHSLGGALAQIIGALKRVPFITFNAPGMRTQLETQGTAFKGTARVTKGLNYRMENDAVSKSGTHIGEVGTLYGSSAVSMLSAHQMGAVIECIQKSTTLTNQVPLPRA